MSLTQQLYSLSLSIELNLVVGKSGGWTGLRGRG